MTIDSRRGRRAVFLDRDGTLNIQLPSYVLNPGELDVFPYAGPALKPLAERGIPLVLISNQAGVAKGLMSQQDLEDVERKLKAALESEGVTLAGAYYCLHTDEMRCRCRKPKPGLFLQAAEEMSLDLERSFMVGDAARDMQAGRAAGLTTVFVPTGLDPEGETAKLGDAADYVAADLADAVQWICRRIDEEG